VPLPPPEPGLVINYQYLWRHEHLAGLEEGQKARPCAVVVATVDVDGLAHVVVAPLTHRRPEPPSEGIELPPRVKQHLGLDWERSWVIVNDLNAFVWPGYDIRPVPQAAASHFDYGFLPPRLFALIVERITAHDGTARLATSRDVAE